MGNKPQESNPIRNIDYNSEEYKNWSRGQLLIKTGTMANADSFRQITTEKQSVQNQDSVQTGRLKQNLDPQSNFIFMFAHENEDESESDSHDELDSLYDKDVMYENDSQFENTSEYEGAYSSDSDDESNGVNSKSDNTAEPVQNPQTCGSRLRAKVNPGNKFFHGYENEDLLIWLRNFEDEFAITRAAKVPQAKRDKVKAKHLIVKLRDPVRSRIQWLTSDQRDSYTTLAEFLKEWYLTESKRIQVMHELRDTYQAKAESIQCFANKIFKLVERVNHGVNDSTLIEKEKIREFKYRLIPKYLAKLALQTFDSFIDVVQAARCPRMMLKRVLSYAKSKCEAIIRNPNYLLNPH